MTGTRTQFGIMFLGLALSGAILVPFSADAALTRTVRGSDENNSNEVETNSFTPSNDSLLVVIVGGTSNGSTDDPVSDSIVTDSTGSLTWTKRISAQEEANGGSAAGWTAWIEIWTAPVTTGVSMTVSGDNSNSMDGMFIGVVEYTGYNTSDPIGATVSDTREETGGSWTITLSGVPATESEVIAGVSLDCWNTCGDEITAGAGWTELYDFADAGPETHGQVQATSSPSSANIIWSDVKDGQSVDSMSAGVAVEIKAQITRALSKPPNNLGLVGYWSFNEGAGTVATDFSGNGNHGTLSTAAGTLPQWDMPSWIHPKRGRALYFNTDGAYVNAGSGSSLNITGAVTVCAWFNASEVDSDIAIVSNMNGSVANGQYALEVFGNGAFSFGWGDGTPNYELNFTAAGAISIDQWYYGCGVRSAGGVGTVYLNGVDVTATQTGSVTPQATPGATAIGRHGSADSQYWDGAIDEVRIYNRALGLTEIAALARSGAARLGASSADLDAGSSLESGLVGHWTLDGKDTQSAITDRSGGNNHGYFSGGATSSAKTIGKLGQAFSFDNDDDVMGVPEGSSLDIPGSLTISFWSYRAQMTPSGAFSFAVAKRDSGSGPATYSVEFGGFDNTCNSSATTYPQFWQTSSGNFDGYFSNTPITPGAWEHWTIVRNTPAGTISFYKNGADAGTTADACPDGQSLGAADDTDFDVSIGNVHYDTFGFDGKLDDVRIYNRVLTSTEVRQLYNLGIVKVRP